jgi:hypothetical protein
MEATVFRNCGLFFDFIFGEGFLAFLLGFARITRFK